MAHGGHASRKDPRPVDAPPDQPIPAQPAPRPKDAPRTMRELREARQGKRASRAKPAENVLREGLRLERVPDPSILVLFGATGDLAHRKVIPALYHLWRTNLLPHEFVLARHRPAAVRRRRRSGPRSARRSSSTAGSCRSTRRPGRSFASGSATTGCDFADPAGFDAPRRRASTRSTPSTGTRGNRLFYLATQPSQFAEIVAQLGRVGLDHERHDGGWRRIVIEKPFGHDLDSAKKLNREVGKVFRESQVYRIDHYLGKETVRNLLVFRFGNGIFEPLWNRRYVDHVQITVAESIGVEDRGAFYEETGASRDVLQNHLLQLVSLVAMEPPATFEADALRDEKVKVLRAIAPDPPTTVRATSSAASTARAGSPRPQVPGYREEAEVDPESETETFVAARLEIDDWRWSGVPFYLRTGKRLPEARDRDRDPVPRGPAPAVPRRGDATPSRTCSRSASSPTRASCCASGPRSRASGWTSAPVTMDFTYGSAFSVDSPDAYETLILDALPGDASLFTRADEVEEAWGIVDPIIDAWADRPAARASRTTTPARGARRGRRADRRATAGAGGGSEPATADDRSPRSPDARSQRAGPALVGAGPQHRRDRAGARPDLGARRT